MYVTSSALCVCPQLQNCICFLIVTADDDYFMITTELTFMSGSPLGTTRSTTIFIRDDPRPEGAENFIVNLVSSVSPVTLGNPSSATVVILGDDGKCFAEV